MAIHDRKRHEKVVVEVHEIKGQKLEWHPIMLKPHVESHTLWHKVK